MARRQHFRSVKDWQSDGLTLTTASDEAAKLYDAALTQVVGWYDDPQFDGLGSTLGKLSSIDPDFVMGKSLCLQLELITTGKTTRLDKELAAGVSNLEKLAISQKDVITDEEFQHAMAVVDWSVGDLFSAAQRWERILTTCPTDIHALKMVHDTYLFLGRGNQIRDPFARVLPVWESKKNLPLHSFLYGMHAFGLEESNMYGKAEASARKGLEINELDCWSTHALSHVFEMEGKVEEGISFLTSTADSWTQGCYLACHNYWHLALCHIERGEPEVAVDIFDKEVWRRGSESKSIFGVVDLASLLYRLDMVGEEVSVDKWNEAFNLCESHLEDSINGFNDTHLMMVCMGAKKYEAAKTIFRNFEKQSNPQYLALETTKDILNAIVSYERECYEETVNLLNPIRYDIVNLGGSHAQRDVFNQLLISAALRSSNGQHQKLAIQLINERKNLKDLSALTDRLQLTSSKRMAK